MLAVGVALIFTCCAAPAMRPSTRRMKTIGSNLMDRPSACFSSSLTTIPTTPRSARRRSASFWQKSGATWNASVGRMRWTSRIVTCPGSFRRRRFPKRVRNLRACYRRSWRALPIRPYPLKTLRLANNYWRAPTRHATKSTTAPVLAHVRSQGTAAAD